MILLKSAMNLFKAPRYILNFPLLNKLGLQVWRIRAKLPKANSKNNFNLPADAKTVMQSLEENGIYVVENFLSENELSQLHNEIQSLRDSRSMKYETGKEGGKIKWEHGNFPDAITNSLINAKFRRNKYLKVIVENYTGRKVKFVPEIIYQKLIVPEGFVDTDDVQTVLHADRHYRTLKMFYAVSDHTVENGAFWYSPGSHVMTQARISFEKEFSYRSALERTGKRDLIDPALLECGRSAIHPKLRAAFPPQQMCVPKNSLIIVDVSGFHKRGLIRQGMSRETIRIIYHYVHAPMWSQYLFKLMKRSPGKYLN